MSNNGNQPSSANRIGSVETEAVQDTTSPHTPIQTSTSTTTSPLSDHVRTPGPVQLLSDSLHKMIVAFDKVAKPIIVQESQSDKSTTAMFKEILQEVKGVKAEVSSLRKDMRELATRIDNLPQHIIALLSTPNDEGTALIDHLNVIKSAIIDLQVSVNNAPQFTIDLLGIRTPGNEGTNLIDFLDRIDIALRGLENRLVDIETDPNQGAPPY